MKKSIVIFLFSVITTCLLQAQSTETITNNSVIKMVKAKLSDELIIDMIDNSDTAFNLSEDALKNLRDENVPEEIIKEMQKKTPIQENSVNEELIEKPVATTDNSQEVQNKLPEENQAISNKEAITISGRSEEALGYVAPLKSLVSYYENEFEVMSVTISDWDRKIKASIAEAAGINQDILNIENELREKKNANANNYDSAILLLYKNLNDNRLKYKELKERIIKDGGAITRKLSDMNKEKERSLGKAYDEVSQQVKSFAADPSKADDIEKITFKSLKINDQTAYNILPATEMLYWHVNELKKISELIEEWNRKADEIAKQNVVLNNRMEPLQKQMDDYKTSPKKFKAEISALKKQINAIEKERKQLAGKMETEKNQMADELKKACKESQGSAKERFNDIIANINYYYQENFNL